MVYRHRLLKVASSTPYIRQIFTVIEHSTVVNSENGHSKTIRNFLDVIPDSDYIRKSGVV